jgi:hypothetical protein
MGRRRQGPRRTLGQEVPWLIYTNNMKTRARGAGALPRAPGLSTCLLAASYFLVDPLRHVDIKLLRSSPFRFFAVASLLQSVIFCCCAVLVVVEAAAGFALRHDDINVFRSSPFRFLAVASLLQSVIFCCCACCAALGCLVVSWAIVGTANPASITRASVSEILRTIRIPFKRRLKWDARGVTSQSAAIV